MNIGKLRDIEDHELELMLSWRNAPNVRANMYTRHEITLEEHKSWWERIRHDPRHQYRMFEEQGLPLGIVAFVNIDKPNGHSSWAFYASPDAPRGTGSKMEFLALDYAFGALALHKLHCEVLDFNTAVISLHKKFGFVVEGVLRQQHFVDGRYADIYSLGLLHDEWEQQRPLLQKKLELHAGK
ncbi:UDP-4-amino-4,6-dideoxy-N-acetyl-beta-L-altrosamine N-acetyltransferase [Pseudomonas citronellolis]|uniref:UDP-4-amino-4, 6-dideoxy-N-acetyl-beta-L-altrosamine N-acetyltransferase n=1 Tax=Pseudomonas citronellolis TaxID=53408 RepID=UPI0023E36DBD|nr:UDP-4-amino-4,6-dideoxy-N-acetyl-beta-L-altrosamine N-acetyltransferase [Pseudomonas citronellolis]MDF3935455.1 UDP-4-amino-4,6-dideoxy-N-acetyl-beta-L-altrosamine N-acetyltransferase [Pseudomonas citronellolis]